MGRCLTDTCKVSAECVRVWEVVGLLPDHTDTINLPPCRGNWCWWMDFSFSNTHIHRQGTRQEVCACMATRRGTINLNLLANVSEFYASFSSLPHCFRSMFVVMSAIPVPLFHPWIVQYSVKGSFAEHYIRAELLMATQKPCKWAVREAHQSSCQMRSPIIIYGHNWPVFPQAMTLHWWIWWWLRSAQQSGRRKREERKLTCAEGMHVWEKTVVPFTWYKMARQSVIWQLSCTKWESSKYWCRGRNYESLLFPNFSFSLKTHSH